MTTATPALVTAQVAEILDKIPGAAVIGLIADPTAWTGPATLEVAGRPVAIAACVSPLAIRVAIADHDDDGPLVILTDVDQADLGAEVRARLAKNRLVPLSRWRAVLSLFAATRLDPRLASRNSLADGVLDLAPPGGYAPAPAAFLDLATVRRALVARLFGADAVEASLAELLRTLEDRATVGNLDGASAEVREEAFAALRERFGRVIDLVAAAADCDVAADLAAVGLAARAVFSPAVGTEALPAAIRLEAYLGKGIQTDDALRLADAAESLVGDRPDARCHRAEAILDEVGGLGFAWASDVLTAGFEIRLRRFGAALERGLAKGAPGPKQLAEIEAAAGAVAAHREAAAQPRRRRNVAMAARLARRLAATGEVTSTGAEAVAGPDREAPGPSTLLEAAEAYVADGGFVDWARAGLGEGDTDAALVAGYTRLAALTGQQRRHEDERFGQLLADWAPAGATSDRAILSEDVLDHLVRPLVAAGTKVCLVVMDGMSQAVFRALIEDLTRKGWGELGRGRSGLRPLVIPPFPTITEVCRTSLLCGRLVDGNQADEKKGFVAALPGGILFHKNDLVGVAGAALPEPVLRALDPSTGPDVVGVVINAIDDHLLKGDQVLVDWDADIAHPLGWILREAAGRIVVLTADHGHVPDVGGKGRIGDAGERWRLKTGWPIEPTEVVLTGPRVLRGGGTVILPWADEIRYSASKRAGYHGGASPREVVVPLAVLTFGLPAPDGWVDVHSLRPAWWDPAVAAVALPATFEPAPTAKLPRPTKKRPEQTEPLFETPAAAVAAPPADWISRLQASARYQSQREGASRRVPAEDRVRAALEALAARGGTLPLRALAEAVGTSQLRISGFMAGLGDLLNVEGYLVVRSDPSTETATLDLALLRTQFGLEGV